MQRRGFVLLLAVLSIFVIMPLASAEIFVGGVESAYNIGDNLNLSITVSSSTVANDFLTSKIVCAGSYNVSDNASTTTNEVEIYRSALNVKAGGEKNVLIDITLDKALIKDLTGNCVIRMDYNGVSADSGAFQITPNLDVTLDLSGVQLMPEEQLNVVGKAYKIRGDVLNGFVEVSILTLEEKVFGSVKDGAFNFSFKIPRTAHAGKYTILAKAYEKDGNGDEINYGLAEGAFNVKQINEKIDLAFSSQTVAPGDVLTFTALLYDQAGDHVSGDLAVWLYYPNNTLVEKRLVKSGKSENFETKANDAPGYWKIETVSGSLRVAKAFYVEEVERASFTLANTTLTVKNIGNVPYNKPVEISIGGVKEIVNVNVSVDAERKFKIYAPNGDYEISVNDGNQMSAMGSSFLTGRAIGVKDLQNLTSGTMLNVIVWAIVILIVAALAIYFYRKVRRGSYSGRKPEFMGQSAYPSLSAGPRWNAEDIAKMQKMQKEESEKEEEIPQATTEFRKEEQSMRERITKVLPSVAPSFISRRERQEEYARPSATVEAGQKQQASVVCLKIKNLYELQSSKSGAMGAVDRALSKAKALRGKIYMDGDFRVIIFSPILTRDSANETRAINVAKQMEEVLTEYNKLHVQKIAFGMGVNSGGLIAEAKDGSFKFTSVGSTISAAKKISETADSEVLLSEMFHRATAGSVKVDSAKGYWKIRRIVNRERNSEFINRFVDRQKRAK